MVTYYKVVSNDGNQLVSAIVFGPFCKVAYAKNVITKPPLAGLKLGRGLLVFSSLESAELFVNLCAPHLTSHLEIWECEITNPKKPQPMCSVYHLNYGAFNPIDSDWPAGTVEVDTVKLTKKASIDPPKKEFRF